MAARSSRHGIDPQASPCLAGGFLAHGPCASQGRKWPSLAAILEDEGGQSTLEYALIAGSLALGLIVSIKLLGGAFGLSFGHHSKALMRAR